MNEINSNKDKEIFRLNNDKKVIINENNKIQKENDEMKANKTQHILEKNTIIDWKWYTNQWN